MGLKAFAILLSVLTVANVNAAAREEKRDAVLSSLNRVVEVLNGNWLKKCGSCECDGMVLDYVKSPLLRAEGKKTKEVTYAQISSHFQDPKRALSQQHGGERMSRGEARKGRYRSYGNSYPRWSASSYGRYSTTPMFYSYGMGWDYFRGISSYPALQKFLELKSIRADSQNIDERSLREVKDLLEMFEDALDEVKCLEEEIKNKRKETLRELRQSLPPEVKRKKR